MLVKADGTRLNHAQLLGLLSLVGMRAWWLSRGGLEEPWSVPEGWKDILKDGHGLRELWFLDCNYHKNRRDIRVVDNAMLG